MRYLLYCILLFWNTNAISAQPDSTYIPFVAEWTPETNHYFIVKEIEYLWEDTTLVKSDTIPTLANLQVLESNENGYLISWRQNFNPVELGFQGDENAEFLESEIIYQVDSLGKFLHVQNWQELSAMSIAEIEKSIKLQNDGQVASVEAMDLIQPTIDQLKTQEGVNKMLTEEIQMIHFPFGRAFSKVKTEHFETTLTVMGGDEVDAIGVMYINAIDRENAICQLVQETTLDPDAISAYLYKFLKNLGAPADQIQSEIEQTRLEVNKTLTYNYKYQDTLPSKVTLVNDIHTEFANRVQKKTKKKIIQRFSLTAQ